MKKKLIIAYCIIGVLLIALVVCIYMILNEQTVGPANGQLVDGKGILMWQPVDDSTALSDIKKYRNRLHLSSISYGVFYDSSVVHRYIDTIFQNLVSSYDPTIIPKGYTWKVGFYFVRKMDRDKRWLDFYVIPTLVGINGAPPLDFFDPGNQKYYRHVKPGRYASVLGGTTCDTCDAYDAGHLWP